MPNHVTNILTIDGVEEDINKLLKGINGGRDEEGHPVHIDFNKIIPMPESLNIPDSSDYEKGYYLYMAVEHGNYKGIDKMLKYPWAQKEGIATREEMVNYHLKNDDSYLEKGKQYYDNIQEYGHPTWYDWSCKNWGTKWNAYRSELVDDRQIIFNTAWAGVPDLVSKLSEQYPDVTLSYEFADEDWGHNVGEYKFMAGECQFVNVPKGGTPEAIEIATRILGDYSYDDEDEDEMEGL